MVYGTVHSLMMGQRGPKHELYVNWNIIVILTKYVQFVGLNCNKQRLIGHYIWLSIDDLRGPGSSVGIVTDYELEGPGSNPGGDEIFRLSRPTLGPTLSPVKWVPGLFRG